MAEDIMNWLDKWNAKLYKNDDGTWYKPEDKITADDFWKKFEIKSYPRFKDACCSHIPPKWNEDVGQFIAQVKRELGGKIEFIQVKEKYCHLIIYYIAEDSEIASRFNELKEECINKLISKGIHPSKGDKYNE